MIDLRSLFLVLLLSSLPSLASAQSMQWESPKSVEGATTVDLDQALEMHRSGVVFIDVRSARQFEKRHIPGAKHLYVNDTFTESNLLQYLGDKGQPFVIYCNGVKCSLSSKAAYMAVTWGFTKVKYFRAGIRAWRLTGNPLEYGPQR